MELKINIPEINLSEEDLKILLSIKLFEEEIISLGKAAEIAGYSEKTFTEIMLHKGKPPIVYKEMDLKEELNNA